MITSIAYIAVLGIIVTAYAFFIEKKIKANPKYKPICDISDTISCTKPMHTPYAKMFILSVTTVGMLYYICMTALALLNCAQVAFLLSLVGVIVSSVLAYILYCKIKTLCLICTSLYLINGALCIAALYTLMQ